MKFAKEVVPFLVIGVIVGALVSLAGRFFGACNVVALGAGLMVTAILDGYFLYFFRDPDRVPPTDPNVIVAGADGVIAQIVEVDEPNFLKGKAVRVSIFLSLFDVHVNRTPISGRSKFLGYFPGQHIFTFKDKSSDVNQHNKILITNDRTKCLVTQIVGPVARRVVYWPDHNNEVSLTMGDKIGLMKFGSRMDMYFPKGDVELLTHLGDRVTAGITVIARYTTKR